MDSSSQGGFLRANGLTMRAGFESSGGSRERAAAADAEGPRAVVWFVWSAGVVLAITGAGKAFAATGPAGALDLPDPFLGLRFRHLMLLVGLAELLVAFFCLFTPKRLFALGAVAWLATSFSVYRAGLWFIGWRRPCGCMGSLTDLLRLSPSTSDQIMKGVLLFLLVGSHLLLLRYWRRGRAGKVPACVGTIPSGRGPGR